MNHKENHLVERYLYSEDLPECEKEERNSAFSSQYRIELEPSTDNSKFLKKD